MSLLKRLCLPQAFVFTGQDDFTRQPLGEDDEERQYWLNDLRPGGLRLCREILPTEDDAEEYLARALAAAARGKGGRKGGTKKVRKASPCIPEEDMGPGRWETIATTLEEVDEVRARARVCLVRMHVRGSGCLCGGATQGLSFWWSAAWCAAWFSLGLLEVCWCASLCSWCHPTTGIVWYTALHTGVLVVPGGCLSIGVPGVVEVQRAGSAPLRLWLCSRCSRLSRMLHACQDSA